MNALSINIPANSPKIQGVFCLSCSALGNKKAGINPAGMAAQAWNTGRTAPRK